MDSELFSIKYVDKHSAALIYKQMASHSQEIGLTSLGIETYHNKSGRSNLKIILSLPKDLASRLPAILNSMKELLREHPLFLYLSFDFNITPISQISWNFDSYDNENWQQVFIRKRKSN